MINKSAIISIKLYQKYISPHKGYCCAYKVHHDDMSCSEYAKLTIEEVGIFRSVSKILNRFRECKVASNYINDEYEENDFKSSLSEKYTKSAKSNSCNIASCFG